MAEQRLQGKIAVVSGGGSGIGKAPATRFAEQGAKVVMLDRTPKHAEETKAAIEQMPSQDGVFSVL
nr:SDR family NAD(P)-dependent oxidoreductase [Paenibacillus maysiensis]